MHDVHPCRDRAGHLQYQAVAPGQHRYAPTTGLDLRLLGRGCSDRDGIRTGGASQLDDQALNWGIR